MTSVAEGPKSRRLDLEARSPVASSRFGFLIATSSAFGWYAAKLGDYNATYGSLGAVVVLLLWLWLSAYGLLLGGELNAELERQTERDSTTGPEQVMGQRRAKMADVVAPGA